MLVQHLVVLEVVQERRRRETGLAGEEHGGAGHDVRRLLFQVRDQAFERHFAAARLVGEERGAAPPGQNEEHHRGTEQQRCPRALQKLEQIGGEEGEVDDDERDDHERRLPQLEPPQLPDDDEGQQAVDHHRGGDGDAIGRGERARRVEHSDQQ